MFTNLARKERKEERRVKIKVSIILRWRRKKGERPRGKTQSRKGCQSLVDQRGFKLIAYLKKFELRIIIKRLPV